MIVLTQNDQLYNNDLRAMIMAFYPGVKIYDKFTWDKEECLFAFDANYTENVTTLKVYGKENCFLYNRNIPGDYRDKSSFRNRLKLEAYHLLSVVAKRTLPWGDLTGVRPTKIAMAQLEKGNTIEDTIRYYQEVYETTFEKARLATLVADTEKNLLEDINPDKDYCLYVGIPFCPSRCLYCSFTSYNIDVYKDKVDRYIERLCEELRFVAQAYRKKRLVAIYMGGGTPTSISHEQLDRILNCIDESFVLEELKEYTIEAGRPDSITEEKLRVMKKHGVSRISINPQTMNDETLKTIGRAHTAEDAVKAFRMAREAGFLNINMDLIAGLPGEDIESMRRTLSKLRELTPESITVHSLAIKRAAKLKLCLDELENEIHHDMDEMLEAVFETATGMCMRPYYLYRQKNIGGNLENVGYSKKNYECLYNILIMEEITDIVATGAGASTKLCFHEENRVERVENCKSVDDYIERFDEMLDRKREYMTIPQ